MLRAIVRGVIGLAGLAMLALGAPPSMANPYFAKQTGRQCQYCHQQGRELSGIHGLNDNGKRFERAFRDDPEKALREFAEGHNIPSHPVAKLCSANFNCDENFAQCYFRIFDQGGGSTIRLSAGESQRGVRVTRGAEFCVSNQSMPGNDCRRRDVKMHCN